jgi:hypothetical protein
MSYNRFERRLAALLDSMPALRTWARSGYRRANYALNVWRSDSQRVHPRASIRRIAGGAGASDADGNPCECFFGYFGLQPWSADGRRHLFHRRRLEYSQTVEICAFDREAGTVERLGESRAWNFQQGSLTQWLRFEGAESVAYNDAVDRRLVCRIRLPAGGERCVEWPIQSLHPRQPLALSLNYRRLARIRPEYGYEPEVENFTADQSLEQDGLWSVDLRSGRGRLLVSLRQLIASAPRNDMDRADHKVNHAVYSPSGARFVFMHRWLGPSGKFSRLYCANADGTGLHLLLDHRLVSHYTWRDENTLLVYARTPEQGDCYHLVDATDGSREAWRKGELDRYGDGHPSYSPDGIWLVTDTYPDRARMSRLLLCNALDGPVIEVAAFHSPWRFDGPVRCDLHPRWSPDGTEISIDSTHEGRRGVYAVDVSRLVAGRT